MEYELNDIVEMKKTTPLSAQIEWQITTYGGRYKDKSA